MKRHTILLSMVSALFIVTSALGSVVIDNSEITAFGTGDKVDRGPDNTVDDDYNTLWHGTDGLEIGDTDFLAYHFKAVYAVKEIHFTDDHTNIYALGELDVQVSTNSTDGNDGDWITIAHVDGDFEPSGGDFTLSVDTGPTTWIRFFMTYEGRGTSGDITPAFYLSEVDFYGLLILKVLSPNGGESWLAGTTENIGWQKAIDSNIPKVKIEYSDSNGQSWNLIDSNATNDGEYDWLIPEVTSNQCLVRISDVNDPNINDTSDDVFTIFECLKKFTGDLDNNCYVNFIDVALLAQDWLECGNPFDPACTINNDLIAYYPFSGDATDATGNGHDGTIHGATLCEDKYTDPNKAYNFDGTDYIAVPDHPALTLGAEPFTIGAWAKLSGFGADGGYYLMGHSNGPGNTNKWIFWLGNSGISFVATPTGWIGLGSYAFELGSWYHVAITRSGTVLTAYVNGSPIGTGTLNGPIYDPSTAFFIGTAEFDRPARPFRGCIDEVRIYDRALTGTEMEYLYNAY